MTQRPASYVLGLCVAWAAALGQASAAPATGARRLFSGNQEALAALAVDVNVDGADELVVIGDGEIIAYDVATGAVTRQWPLPSERPVTPMWASGYFLPATGELVLRASTRLGGNRLALEANAVTWDAEPNYPMCVGEVLRPTSDPSVFMLGERQVRWLRCGELVEGGRRLQWRGILSKAYQLEVSAAWCEGTSCEPPMAWGPYANSGHAYAVGARAGQLFVASARAVAQGGGGDAVTVWAADASARRAKPLWVGAFAGGIVAIGAFARGKTAPARLIVVTRFVGIRRFDVWEVAW